MRPLLPMRPFMLFMRRLWCPASLPSGPMVLPVSDASSSTYFESASSSSVLAGIGSGICISSYTTPHHH